MKANDTLHNHDLLFDYVRKVRAEALNLHDTAEEITQTLKDTSLTSSEVQMRIQHGLLIGNKIIDENGQQVQKYLDAIDDILLQNPELNNWDGADVGGDITIIRDTWLKVKWDWPKATQDDDPGRQVLLYQLNEMGHSLLKLCVTAQMLTFPDLVNQNLKDMRTGEALNFFSEFSDAFYLPEFLPIAWQYLRNHPREINGFMTENGMIYRASPSKLKRVFSPIKTIALMALGVPLILLLAGFFPIGTPDILIKGYLAVVAGGVVHTFVEVWKQYKTQPDHTVNILDNWTLWVHVKETSILYGILTLWAGFIILLVIGQIHDFGAAFFAGYSIDSFLGLFLTRFTDTASQRVATLISPELPRSTTQQVFDVLAQYQAKVGLSAHTTGSSPK